MATARKGPNKSAFLRELFGRNPQASLEEANQEWTKAGHEGSISESSFYNTKSAFNKQAGDGGGAEAGGEAGRKPKAQAAQKGKRAGRAAEPVEQANGTDSGPEPAGEAAMAIGAGDRGTTEAGDQGVTGTGGQEQSLDKLEGGIDDLIFQLKTMGGRPEVEEALRRARRLLYRGQE